MKNLSSLIGSSSINLEKLSSQQVRLLKTCMAALVELSHTNSEESFFTHTAEFFEHAAALVKHAHFSNSRSAKDGIAYAEQALELSLESVQEIIYSSKLKKYDQ